MKLSPELNLVAPIEFADGTTGWLHSTPIAYDVWAKYFEPISIALSEIYANNAKLAAPRMAAFKLQQIAERLGVWDGADGVDKGLMATIRNGTNVVIAGENGYDTLPYYTAIQRGLLTARDAGEIDNLIVFFILVSAVHGTKKTGIIQPLLAMWDALLISLSFTAFVASLPTLIAVENTGAPIPA